MNSAPKHTPAELMARYPFMFKNRHEISFATGWIDLLSEVCDDIADLLGEDKHRFHWLQIKEKFGSARFYWQLGKCEPPMAVDIFGTEEIVSINVPSVRKRKYAGNDEMHMKQLGELVRAAEQKTREMCIACGAPGKLDSTGGYMYVLCPEHIKQRRARTLAGVWFEPNQ